MYKRNNGSTEQEKLQNRFTSLVNVSIRREKMRYLSKREYASVFIIDMSEDMFNSLPEETDFVSQFVISDIIADVIGRLTVKERNVLISRVIEEKSFEEIADMLGMKYKGVAAIYYRTIAKLRKELGGLK